MFTLESTIRKTKKNKEIFYLTKEQMKKRVKFCNSILEKN